VKLTEWARANGVHPKTAYRWWREGILPVPARNRAEKALRCAERDVGPTALSHPDAKVSE
jgi:predicted site-specific integrase-resolvase